ncbi:hypothetical protein QEN19_000090 [Hanseniaspora menglaensis]
MITSLFIMDLNGETIFNKIISDNFKKNMSFREIFKIQVVMEINKKLLQDLDNNSFRMRNSIILNDHERLVSNDYHADNIPIFTIGTTTFHHIYRNGIYIVALSQSNSESFIIWNFLISFHDILKANNLTQALMINNSLLKLINIVNFLLSEDGIPEKSKLNVEVVKKFLIQSY